jgi:hypothetical protein
VSSIVDIMELNERGPFVSPVLQWHCPKERERERERVGSKYRGTAVEKMSGL